MKKLVIFFMLVVQSIIIFGQNYLYENGKSGFSPGAGIYLRDFKDYQGYSFHIDYTFEGRVSVGIAHTSVKSLYSSIIDTKATTFNLSGSIVKIEKPNSSFCIPLVLSYAQLQDESNILSFGGGIAITSKISPIVKMIPVFLVSYNKVKNNYFRNENNFNFGFELNTIIKKIRISPSITLSESISLFGIDVGLVL